MRSSCVITAFLLLLAWPAAQANEQSPADATAGEPAGSARPRIGLVLGGGGARGAAHIGVLRELERLQVPVDAIAGTSMGAIVGGLYATGKTPAELEEIVATLDWADSFKDKPPRRDLPYRRKQDDAAFPIQFELGVREGKLRLPRGLIQGQKLAHILRELTEDTAGITDFDKLPIPFHAVASNLASGEAYVMRSGDLAEALRASMSAPGIFAPVVFDGRTLVDGGLVGNVPVETIRDMGVDIVIAVDVEFPLYPPDELNSALDVTAQMLTILIRKETRRQLQDLGDDDILIRPELGLFGSTNFAEIRNVIEPGATAALREENRLRELSLDDGAWSEHLQARAARIATGSTTPRLAFVRVQDGGPLSSRVLEARLETEPGDLLDPAALAADAANLYGLNLYEQVDYRIVREQGETGVEFLARPKSWGPNYLRFGVALEDDFEGTTSFNLSARLTRAGMNGLGAEWRTDAQIGTEPLLESEFYQPLSYDSLYFIAPRVLLRQRNLRTFAGDERVARYRLSEAEAGLDAGRELGRWGEFRVGVFRGVGSADLKVGDPALPDFDFDSGGFFANFAIDTLDDAQVPLDGTRLNLRWELLRPGAGADAEFDTVSAEYLAARTWGRHTLQFGLDYATTIETDSQVQNFFPLGGFLRLSGLARGEISGPHAGLARLVWYRRSGETGGGVFNVPLYVGASLEAGNVWQERSAITTGEVIVNGSIFIGLDTYFGPLYLAAGFAEQGASNFYLSLGQPR